jgi:hypothetical protein
MKIPNSWSCLGAILAFAGVMARGFAFGNDNGALPASDSESATPIPPMTARRVEAYAYAGGTDTEIAERFGVDESTIRHEFADVLRVARARRRLALRGLQYELAKKLNGPVLMWLGRNELGQSNNPIQPGEPEPEID